MRFNLKPVLAVLFMATSASIMTTSVQAQDDETLIGHISNGFESPGAAMPMPAKGGNTDLSDEDIENVLAYLRKEFGK